MIDVKFHNRGLRVAGVPQLETDLIRAIPGARHNRATDTWDMPFTRAQVWGLSDAFGKRLAVSPDVSLAVTEQLVAPAPYVPHHLDPRLFDFQEQGVRTLLQQEDGMVLGDDMGTGKTIQAISLMKEHGGLHLVVSTKSMLYKWEEEIHTWWPEADVVVISGTPKQKTQQFAEIQKCLDRSSANNVVAVINYEALRLHSGQAPFAGGKALTEDQKKERQLNAYDFNVVVFDEAHKLCDPTTAVSKCAVRLAAQANYVLPMTGTLIRQNPDDIWSVMRLTNPEEWGSRGNFRERYCVLIPDFHAGIRNVGLRADTRHLFDAIFVPRFLRRTKEEVLPDLPEILGIDYRSLPLTTKQEKAYKAMVKDFITIIDGDLLTAENPLTLLTRLRQIACAVPEVVDDEVVALTKDSNKLDALLDILEELDGGQLVVYGESRKFIEMLDRQLQEAKFTTGMVTGQTAARLRTRNIDQFQAGQLQVLLGTLGAGAEGITLTAASTIVLAQQSWSHLVNTQAIDRVHRIGQMNKVRPIVLLSKDTVDENVRDADARKEDMLEELVRDKERLKAVLSGKA